ncbi:unnamed protein product [Trichobilharzia szidati]|nr:unnamed protein product [Trichobilharzia szidati]
MDDSGNNPQRKQGTRVFKKSSPNGKITTYLCKRDFIDSLAHVDPIEGVVLVDPEYVKGRKVYTHVLSAFRYGREDLDVLGLTFRKDLYLSSAQVYPPVYASENGESGKVLLNPASTTACGAPRSSSNNNSDLEGGEESGGASQSGTLPLTRLQERLIKKLGSNAFPFYFKLPPDAPASVTLQPGPNENGKPCGVDYELRTYVADNSDEKLQKRNAVRLAIRKLTYAPEEPAPQPSAVVLKEFIMSPGTLRLEVSLNKEKYYHGESIEINVLVDNNSNKTVKKIKLSVRQYTQLCLHNNNRYSCVVDELETDLCNPNHKENLGMTVQYRVKVRLVLGFVSSDVSVELPFTLTHPKPDPETDGGLSKIADVDEDAAHTSPSLSSESNNPSKCGTNEMKSSHQQSSKQATSSQNVNIIDDLIKLDDGTNEKSRYQTNGKRHTIGDDDDDDLIFEDFARLRLKTYEADKPSDQLDPSTGGVTMTSDS